MMSAQPFTSRQSSAWGQGGVSLALCLHARLQGSGGLGFFLVRLLRLDIDVPHSVTKLRHERDHEGVELAVDLPSFAKRGLTDLPLQLLDTLVDRRLGQPDG
jgi:hypothetical protein